MNSNGVNHFTSRGNEKKPVFKDDADRQNFLNTLPHVNKRYNWICHAYCLVDEHYHLLKDNFLPLVKTSPEVYSPQQQITRAGVKKLRRQWTAAGMSGSSAETEREQQIRPGI